MSNDKAADEFAGFFAVIGFILGAAFGLEAVEGDGNALGGILGGGLFGAFLGGVIGHVLFRLILVALFLGFFLLRMHACGLMGA